MTETNDPMATPMLDEVESLAQVVAQQPCSCIVCESEQQRVGNKAVVCPACRAIALLQRFVHVRVR